MSGNLWYDGPVAVQALKAVLIVSIRHTKKSSEIPFYETEYIYSYSQWVSIALPPREPGTPVGVPAPPEHLRRGAQVVLRCSADQTHAYLLIGIRIICAICINLHHLRQHRQTVCGPQAAGVRLRHHTLPRPGAPPRGPPARRFASSRCRTTPSAPHRLPVQSWKAVELWQSSNKVSE